MPKNKKRFLQFTLNRGSGATSPLNTPQASPLPYTFHSLPLNVFIDQIEAGTVDQSIYDNFFYTIRDKQQNYIDKQIKEINLLEAKYNHIMLGIKIMESEGMDEQILKVIKGHISINMKDSLSIIYAKSKKLIIDADIKKKELERIIPKEKGGKADRDFFDFLIFEVSKYLRFQIDIYKTTVSQFARMINSMREAGEAAQKQIKNVSR